MHNISRNLDKKSAKKHMGLCALLFLTQLTACAPSSGGGNAAGEGLMCNQNLYEEKNNYHSSETSTQEQITVDPNIDSYIVEFENDSYESSSGLQPSGNSIHEYEVSGLSLKSIRTNTFSFKLPGDLSFKKEMIQRLGNKRKIKFIEPDYPLYLIPQDANDEIQATASTTSAQWHHQTVQTPSAWQLTKGSQDIVVAVVDSGIDHTHPDLQANMWVNSQEIPNNGRDDDRNGYIDDIRGWNFFSNNSNPKTTSSSNHGTHVAGIIGATGRTSRGVYGEAQKVKGDSTQNIPLKGSMPVKELKDFEWDVLCILILEIKSN